MRRPMHPSRRRGALGDLSDLIPSLLQYAANAGFSGPDLATAVAIALAESSGNPNEIGDRTLAPANGPSYGLWQINIGSKAHPEFASLGQALLDPQTNANAAYSIYSRAGGSFSQWTTYTTAAYMQYLPQVLAAQSPAPAPLTIDASTGQPIADSTPTPLLTPAVASVLSNPPNALVGVAAAAIGAVILWDVLS